MKKTLLILMTCLLLFGCNKMDSKKVVNEFKKALNTDKYELTGQMDIVSNEELYHYDVTVDYMKGDYYKAILINKDNKHEQIILKNEDGVYIITPELNKSFKFQSEWPYNSSQAYILESLLKDLESDSNLVYEEREEDYVLSSTVNYPNNSSLISQKIVFSKDFLPKQVDVYNKDGIINISLKISKIDLKPNISKDNFDLKSSVSYECCSVSKIDSVVYPMYLPTGTLFKNEETIKTEDTERVILTFTGDKSFTLIEEASKAPSEFEVTTTSGELVFYENILGNLAGTTLNWTMDGKNYYIISENLTNEELLKVASSTSVVSLTK